MSRPPLPNLTAIIEDASGGFRPDQKQAALAERNLREFRAFGRLHDGDRPTYFRAYLEYTERLSSEERAHPRYADVIPRVVAALAEAEKGVSVDRVA